ncbi:MAG: alanine--glyoxylate aminotransferase family protein [Candidatus Aureabacteria bacterium]|nr:alanine--glyoxylate aminotransferase family protein [Candidatus Auribacterota bacterium]
MKKEFLLAPGPSQVPPETLLEMAKPVFHHRTKRFQNIFAEVQEGLKYVFQTKNPVLVFASSGTGAMEGAVSSVLSPGDKAISVVGGKFGERWSKLCKAFGVQSIDINVEWGKTVDPAVLKKELENNKGVKAVYVTLVETSTGTLADIKKIGEVVKNTPAILVVDAISGLGADMFMTDEWNVDIAISGSQKALMLPPGLAFASVSEKAMKLVNESKNTSFYFSFKKAKASLDKNDTAYTPAVTLIIGLKKSLDMIKEETIEKVWKRHEDNAAAMRQAVKAIGLKLYSQNPANAVTAVWIPETVDGSAFVKKIRDEYGVTMAGGQEDLKGRIFRVAQMGYANQFDTVVASSAIEMVLAELGYGFERGAATRAAVAELIKRGVK